MGVLRDARPATQWPPPCPLSNTQRAHFERAGMPILNVECYAQRYEGELTLNWSAPFLGKYCSDVASGVTGGTYGHTELTLLRGALQRLILERGIRGVAGASGLVMGSETPWVECLLLNEGARLVTTFEYASINTGHERLRAPPLRTVAADYFAGTLEQVDIVVSFSSLEHSGLGRYGDALSPDGDRDALAQAWCMLRPGGLLVLGVPMSCKATGQIVWNAHRVYGFERLAYVSEHFLLEGFASTPCTGAPTVRDGFHPIVVLRKPFLLDQPPPPLTAQDFARVAPEVAF